MKPKDLKLVRSTLAYRIDEATPRLVICSEVVALAFPELPPRLLLRLTKHKPKHNPHWTQLRYEPEEHLLYVSSYAPHLAAYFTRYCFIPSYSRLIELVRDNPLYPFLSLILPTTTN